MSRTSSMLDSEVGVDDVAVRGDLVRCALRQLATVVQHDDTVADGHHHFHHVFDDQQRERELLFESSEDLDHLPGLGHGEPGHDLVEEQQFRARGQRAGQLEPSSLREQQVLRQRVLAMLEFHAREEEIRPSSSLGQARTARMVATKQHCRCDVVLHGDLAERSRELERAGDAPAADLVRAMPRDVLVFEQHLPGRGLEAADHVEQGGLASAVGPDDPEHLTALDREIDAIQSLDAAEALADPPRLEEDAHYVQSRWLASRAPSASMRNFSHMMLGCTRAVARPWANPQSTPAMTFSRPTIFA